jgi:uncharacterized protein (TIGR02421 family)
VIVASASPAGRLKRGKRPEVISAEFVSLVVERLVAGKRVRRGLPVWGRVHIDRQLPFLCVFRRKPGTEEAGTETLVIGEASYLTAHASSRLEDGLKRLLRGIVTAQGKHFGAFILLEIWEGPAPAGDAVRAIDPARFRLVAPPHPRLASTLLEFEESLTRIVIRGKRVQVEQTTSRRCAPEGLPRLISDADAAELGCETIGLEVPPIYRDEGSGKHFPLVLRALRRGLSRALKRGFFEFVRTCTTQRPAHYLALGRRSFVKAVFAVDRELAAISNDLDFLLAVSPVNTQAAWERFRRRRYQHAPEFVYRRLPLDPALMKRRLFSIPIERIEDPVLEQLFTDQQAEFDRKLTMLMDRGSRRFRYGSLQLFGGVEAELSALARDLLRRITARDRAESGGRLVDARAFVARAEKELEHYRAMAPTLRSRVHLREDLSGLMVSHGDLLVGADLGVPASRVDALLSHEIGTHVVTYFNGRSQPFQQLYVGLPGYEELQEGLAVLAEYLVGGLSAARLKLLAARVLAVEMMIDGATFVDLFRVLTRRHGFQRRSAFGIATRIVRGGGLTKDAVYLRGLSKLLKYLVQGGAIERLYVGKFGFAHIPLIEELEWRRIVRTAPLRSRHLVGRAAEERIRRLRNGLSVFELVEGS